MASTSPKKILFLTNSDYGQANVVLATAYELVLAAEQVQVHIASFEALRPAVLATDQLAAGESGRSPGRLIFHTLLGMSQFDAAARPDVDIFAAYDRPPTVINAARTILSIEGIMQPWGLEEFAELYEQTVHVVKQVKPDLTVVEPLFSPGLTVCHHVGVKWIVLSPNTIKDFAVPEQPRLAGLWKYPIVGSGMPFPLPWSLIPKNIALNLVAVYLLLTGERCKNAQRFLQAQVGDEGIQLITAMELGVLGPSLQISILVANTAELDYPFDVMPSKIIPCGPIIRASLKLDMVDRSLEKWLARGPTLYVNLGSHLEMTLLEAVEMASAFRNFLDEARPEKGFNGGKLQILWKLKTKGAESGRTDSERPEQLQVDDDVYERIRHLLGKEMDRDQIRLTSWVTAEPKSVLESGHIVCSINHGGASSFNEALCAGVPQVVLPAWADCYDFANRAELLGIGRWGNKSAKPRWRKKELCEALVGAILGPEAEKIRLRAQELAERYPEGSGRRRAAEVLLEALQ
ncbi:glycosyltransferase family 1 [Fusarium mundagurra]|uniref:Glycosyltransferase family 1 n=1 Tax=Fusarium mundagurra TaxID=1567541 RepID=A0A8H5XSF2_9HYPO|nr:glycosyltransferase family 1 [Fusarium mundagurra]